MANWEDNIRKVTPYVPGEQPKAQNIIKLNTNENPYPPAPGVVRVLRELNTDLLRRYPDPAASLLVDAIAEYYRVKPGQVFVGVGSDDVLAMAFLTCFNADKPILFPDITYSFYDVWAELFRIPYEVIPLDENFLIRTEDYQRENGGVVFPNPNAPTGALKSLGEIEEIIKCNRDVIVIVDEAYIDFGGESALPLLKKYDNLLIAQTFSKSRSMAGMRIGYLLGNEKLIKYINDCKYSFNSYTMNQTAIVMGVEAVKDNEYFLDCTKKIIDTREWAKEKFLDLGFTFADSMSNFLFVTHPSCDAQKLFEALREAGIFVRHFNRPERIKNYLRISVGTREEMEQLFAFLSDYIRKQ
ncbi:MAG: histidinol-phosphate transaminase [Roseburia sp.]|nr:histidinol-phosphate transaminase [Roseburia sp.]